jgi:hypothetical protein
MPDKMEGKPRALWEREYTVEARLRDDNEWRPVPFKQPGFGLVIGPAGACEAASQPLKFGGSVSGEATLQQLALRIEGFPDKWTYWNPGVDIASLQRTSGIELGGIHSVTCKSYLTDVLEWTPGNELEQFHLETSESYLTDFLARHHDDSDEKLGEIVDALLDYNRPDELRVWLNQNLEHWLAHRVVALAAIIEAAVRLSPPALGHGLVCRVLRYKYPHPLVASVAAQRIRLLHIENRNLRGRIWKAVRGWIDLWAQDSKMQEHAVMALPSVPYVAGKEAVSWLSQLIGRGPDRIAWGAALAALDWASGNCTETEPMDEESARVLSDAILDRLRNERTRPSDKADAWAELVPTLVLGATATTAQLPKVARVLAEAFGHANGIEDAAAVRAGKMLVRQLRDEASKALIDAFGADPPLNVRFWTAIAV